MHKFVQTFFLLVALVLTSTALWAQPNLPYYWKGGSGDINDPNMWWVNSFGSGTTATQAPNSTNTIHFTEAAFLTAGAVVTVNANANCDSMLWDNAIPTVFTPTFSSNSSVSIDVYGSFALADNLNFGYKGMLRFRSQRNGIETIDPKGKMMQILKMEFDGSATTEFRLLSKLHVEDLNNSKSNLLLSQGGFTELLSGTFNTNGQEVSFDFFRADNNNVDRGLILNNSTITVDGYHNQDCWRLDFDTTTNNYTTFDATGSHLVFNWYNGYNWVEFGRGIEYDSVTMQADPARPVDYHGVYCYLNLAESQECAINHLILNTRMYFIYSSSDFTIHNLYFNEKRAVFGWYTSGSPHIYLENVVVPSSCDHFFPITRIATGSTKMTIHKLTPGTLTLNNVLLENVECDITGGRSYVANNSIDGHGNNVNWTINEPANRQLYFRDVVNNDWHNVGNWFDDAAATIPAGCIPTAVDDVFFDASSFSSNTVVRMDSTAYCHDINFDNNIPASSQFQLDQILRMFGDLRGCPTIQLRNIGQGYIYGFGTSDTIQTNDALMNVDFLIESDADYRMIGNYNAPSRGINARHWSSTLRAESDSIFVSYFYIGTVFLDSTQVFMTRNDRWSCYDRGGAKNYTGTATFHFQPTSTFTAINIRTMPNVIFYGPAYCVYYDVTIQGDLTLMDDGNFSYSYYGNYTARSRLNVTGSMALYNGDMNLTAGKQYTFSSAVNSFIQIAGDLNAQGNCAELVNMQTTGYNTATIPITVSGTANIDYAYLQGMDNSANPAFTATNSIDAGNNSNITFTSGAGTTFYWRAFSNDATDFEGDWTDPGHWTTNPANLQGDSTCIPSIQDSVIFDANSFSGTSNGCNVSGFAYCKSLVFRADAKLTGTGSTNGNVPESPNRIFIDESLNLDNNMTNFDFRGAIHMVGSGDFDLNGTTVELFKIEFDNPTGTWEILNDIVMSNTWTGSTTYRRYGIFSLRAGTVNTNDHDLTLPAQFVSTGTAARTLNLGSSVVTVKCNGTYYEYWTAATRYPWDVRDPSNFTLNAGTSQIIFEDDITNYIYSKHFYMGDGLTYNKVRFEDLDDAVNIYRSTNYGYLELLGTSYLYDNNSFDSLRLEGGQYYYFGAGSVQTLNAPHGKLIANGNSGSFVFMESMISGATTYLHKPYGYAFCLDFVKVKDMEGTKETNMALVPTVPTDFQALHPFLEFQTGVNSDNINGTATGIWAFNLPPLVSPQLIGNDSIHICKFSAPMYAPLTMTGTSPYFIDYTWTDNNSGSGANTLTITDDDADPATPFTYYMPLASNATEIQYSVEVTTSRCGDILNTTPVDVWVFAPKKDTLVDFPTTASCELNNESTWYTFMDDIEEEPIVALRDSVNTSDNQALGLTNVEVFFDPTVQTVSYMAQNYPYLQRHWDIVPTNNGPARIRLFFTQQELDALAGANTFSGNQFGALNPSTEIQVLKYSSGTIGVGVPTVLPHTVVAMAGNITAPFDDLTDVIAVEVEVSSFSHFIIIPTQAALLPIDLTSFDVQVTDNNHVQIDWTASNEQDISYYEVERSTNAIEAELVLTQTAKGLNNSSYTVLDNDPYRGTSYYRIKAVAYDGTLHYSDWQAVELDGWEVVNIFPVPAKDQLTIQLSSTESDVIDLTVYDALGTRVQSTTHSVQVANNQQLYINTTELSSGVYYLQISNEKGYTQQRKFVVQQ